MRIVIGIIMIFVCCFLPFSVSADYEPPNKLIAGYNSELPPFSYQSSKGSAAGFAIDLMKKIAKDNNMQVVYKPIKERELLNELERGKIDVILGIKYSSTNEERASFSDAIFTLSESLYTLKDNNSIYSLSDLNHSVVAVSSSSSSVETLDHIRGVKLNIAASQPAALDLILLGRSDSLIGNPWTINFLLNESDRKHDLLERINVLQPYELSFAVSKDRFELTQFFNREFLRLKTEKTFQEIHHTWFNQYEKDVSWIKTLAVLLGVAMTVSVGIILLGFLWNKRLQNEVDKKTTELTRSFLFQDQILNSVDTGIVYFQNQGNIDLMNARATVLLRGDYTGQNVSKIEPIFDIWRIMQSDPMLKKHTGEWKFNSDHNLDQIIHYVVVPLKNEKADSVGWILALDDMTDESFLQKKLMVQEKLKALGQLTAGIAHELRNPLTSLKLFIDLLPAKIHDSRFREELIKHVPAEIKRLNDLVEDLLDYTRRKEPVKEWVPLQGFLESLLYSFKIKVQSQAIQFNLQVEECLEWYGDKQRIKQVLINLIMNAIEAVQATEEKIITVSTLVEEGYFYIIIEDNGIGMSEENQMNLFQPFFTTKGSGVGLGLYTSYNIMLEHGGDIEVQSKEGVGSVFRLKFQGGDIR